MIRRRTLPEALELAACGKAGFMFREAQGGDRFRSYRAVLGEALRVAGGLRERGLGLGARVVIVVPEPEEFLSSFLGASVGGLIPVPAYPPLDRADLGAYLEHLGRVVEAARASAILTTAPIRRLLGAVAGRAQRPLAAIDFGGLDGPPLRDPARLRLEDLAFIQFTSGSTSRPKGVVLTHENLAANVGAMGASLGAGRDDVGVSWLPLFHDMGLIGMALGSIYLEMTTTILSPRRFLQRPAEWLRAISDHGGTISFAPNFAYGFCVRRVRDIEIAALNLSRWRIAGCGAEPIQEATLLDFARRFAPAGFRKEALLPCYGMAEHTLAVSFPAAGRGLNADTVLASELRAEGRAVPCAPEDPGAARVVSCGRPFPGHAIQIVDEGGAPLPERTVGEISLSGPSVMWGYEGPAELSADALRGGWLRTGDLGYLSHGELFVCGRQKDVIVVNGKKYHPQDIEWTVGEVPGVRRGNVVAFGAGAFAGRERVVVVAESKGGAAPDELGRRVRRRVDEVVGLRVDEVVIAPPGTLPKTSSGKLQRARARARWEEGTLLAPRRRSGLLRHLVASQLGYWRAQLFGR